MWSEHADRKQVAYQGLHARQPRRAVLIHTNGGGSAAGSLFGWWTSHANGSMGRDNLHIGAQFQIPWNGRAEQYCLTPDARVLTADLRWVPLGDLHVGQQIVGFDEDGPFRQYRQATVESVAFATEPVFAVVLEDERVIYATAEHRWLTSGSQGLHWRYTRRVYSGARRTSLLGARLPQMFKPWEMPTDYDRGWLAGLLDGEGTSRPNALTFAQNPGPVLDHALAILKHLGVDFSVNPNGDCRTVNILGGLRERLAFLGSVRPDRLIRRLDIAGLGGISSGSKPPTVGVLAVYPAGEREIAKVATSTGTYIAEGFPMHNCDTDLVVYHAYGASEWAVGIEVQDDGDPSRPMSDAQLAAIVAICSELHVPGQEITSAAGGDGVGWHSKFPSWNQTGHDCPGDVRVEQIRGHIIPALALPPAPSEEDDDMSICQDPRSGGWWLLFPNNTKRPITGAGSLAAYRRAFKDVTGLTPAEIDSYKAA